MIIAYVKEIEGRMQEFYNRLAEKNRRLYAGIEALKLAFGGITPFFFNNFLTILRLTLNPFLANKSLILARVKFVHFCVSSIG
jgi:hypothetical protein